MLERVVDNANIHDTTFNTHEVQWGPIMYSAGRSVLNGIDANEKEVSKEPERPKRHRNTFMDTSRDSAMSCIEPHTPICSAPSR